MGISVMCPVRLETAPTAEIQKNKITFAAVMD